MKVRYSKGANSETAQITFDAALDAGFCRDGAASMTYDNDSRTVYLHPPENGSRAHSVGGSYRAGFLRIQPRHDDLPRCAQVEVDAVQAGNVMMFTLPENLPPPISHPHRTKSAPLTPQGIVEAFQAAMADYPGLKLKVLVPGHGLLTISPDVIKVSA